MSHIVIHDDADGVAQYHEFDDLESSITYVERLRNRAGVEDARLFEMSEVVFEMKAYFKVELGEPDPASVVEMISAAEILPTADEADVVFETTAEPIETITARPTPDESDTESESEGDGDDDSGLTSAGGDTRRGLFGR